MSFGGIKCPAFRPPFTARSQLAALECSLTPFRADCIGFTFVCIYTRRVARAARTAKSARARHTSASDRMHSRRRRRKNREYGNLARSAASSRVQDAYIRIGESQFAAAERHTGARALDQSVLVCFHSSVSSYFFRAPREMFRWSPTRMSRLSLLFFFLVSVRNLWHVGLLAAIF